MLKRRKRRSGKQLNNHLTSMYRILTSFGCLFLSLFSFSQSSVVLSSENKTYTIKPGEECYITTIPVSDDTCKPCYTVHIGTISSVKDSAFAFTEYGLNTVKYDLNGKKKLYREAKENISLDLKFSK